MAAFTKLGGDCPDMNKIGSVSSVSDVSDCKQECTNHPKCTGFSYDKANGQCIIRSGPVCSPVSSSSGGDGSVVFYKRNTLPPSPSPKHDNTMFLVVICILSLLVVINLGSLVYSILSKRAKA